MSKVPGKHGHRLRRVIWAAVTLLGMILAIRLGQWQGNKAQAKMEIMQLYAERQRQPAQPVAVEQWEEWAKKSVDTWRLRSVRIQATPAQQPVYQWVAHQGQWGRCLFGLLHIQPGYGILAKLGWVPEALDSTKPAIWPQQTSSVQKQEWTGQLYVPEKRWSSNSGKAVQQGQAIEYIDLHELEKTYQIKLFPGVLELHPQTDGCRMIIPSSEGIQKHRSYQYQWYAIALAMGVLYGIYGWRRESR